jgi:hypothetical protein
MRTRLVLLALLVASLAVLAPAQAGVKAGFTAIERFDPFGLIGAPVGALLAPPTVACPGFEPTGDPVQPCPPGSRVHLRGFRALSRFDSAEPLVAGWLTVEADANFTAQATGPQWGTWSLVLDAGGVWEGTFNGIRSFVGDRWESRIHIVGHGTAGAVEGMQFKAVDVLVTSTPSPLAYIGTVSGRLLDPSGN